jgi:dipeptidyl aminopeptidase/acylaminoacyl peptidase
MNARFLLSVASLFAVINLSGCAVAPTHPSLTSAALPALIPVRDFVADRESTGGYSVSPDGKKLAWIGIDGFTSAVWVKTIAKENAKASDKNDAKAFHRRARYYRWSADSQYLAIVTDSGGDEDAHIYVGKVQGSDTKLVDVTPFEKTSSHITRVIDDGAEMIVTSNRRDKKVFDPYKLDLTTGKLTLLATNPGNVAYWGVDREGILRGRVVLEGEQSLLQVPNSAEASSWKTTAKWGRFDSVHPVEMAEGGKWAWALSNRGRDKQALVKLDLATGDEAVVYEVPEVDVDRVMISRKTQRPLLAYSMPNYQRLEVYDPVMKQRLQALAGDQPANVVVTSIDHAESTYTVSIATAKGSKSYLISSTAEPQLLGENSLSRLASALSTSKPISYSSRDGLQIHGYLTLPEGTDGKNLPMVLYVHGGPWARDRWENDGQGKVTQMMANRGYAVLQVNYRGSSGYGRAFQDKAIGEFAGKMHDDLIDGVNWAVKSGVADPAKVAIYGGSYGGYAAMLGATITPEVFACAVNIVGVTSLARLLETVPPYWELGLPWWYRFVGDPAKPADRAIMDAKSPLFHAAKATKPILILHGVNDPRVKLEQSELMVAALKKEGKQVDYVIVKGDGHGNFKWNNNMTLFRKTEDFLAKCLGGRSSGFDYYQLGAWAF